MQAGIVSVGSEAVGSYKFDFTFTFKDDNTPAVLPYLPLTFYDLDGKPLTGGRSYEVAKTCDAEGVIVTADTLIAKASMEANPVIGGAACAVVHGGTKEVAIPEDWTTLGHLQKQVGAIFAFRSKSKFTMEYTLNYRHRVFIMQGSRSMVC